MLLSLVILVLVVFMSLLFTHFTGAIWSPTPIKTVKKMLELASLKRGEKLYDLGCGDGRIAIMAAKMGAKAVGVEINPFLYLIARLAGRGIPNLELRWGNLYRTDLSDADVVTLYLSPSGNRRLVKILKRLKKGARIVSYRWPLPLNSKQMEEGIYLYVVEDSL
jgi:SAM-dependent methyltransferase